MLLIQHDTPSSMTNQGYGVVHVPCAFGLGCLGSAVELSRANQERASINVMARASIDASSDKHYRTDQ
ncbi:hypothetical protein DY000_02041581 [Brassica cretica]|nr:hypothetical protein DY000_02041581 [Brassica cretica]